MKGVQSMRLDQLRYIVKVVECGSITEAAEQLFMSQPSLSAAIKQLEEEMGITIFNRSNRGVSLSVDGTEFLAYARQILEQTDLMIDRYHSEKPAKKLLAISTQHYAFSVNAFVQLLKNLELEEYDFTLRETRTYDIIADVAEFRSDIGILYLSDHNERVIRKLLKERGLTYHALFEASPHVFVTRTHPLAHRKSVDPQDLAPYPFLAFEQGEMNSGYFAEEVVQLSKLSQTIHVSDRATIFNLIIGLNGYTISSGILSTDLNGEDIISIPLNVDATMRLGWISNDKAKLTSVARVYIHQLQKIIESYGYTTH